jgi:hypothetical protein
MPRAFARGFMLTESTTAEDKPSFKLTEVFKLSTFAQAGGAYRGLTAERCRDDAPMKILTIPTRRTSYDRDRTR